MTAVSAPPVPAEVTHVRPLPGPQDEFLQCGADIAIMGGAAGGSKSYGLLLDPTRHCFGPYAVPGFGAVIFRRTRPQITNEGGLWDTASELYPGTGAGVRVQRLEYVWPHPENPRLQGPSVRFAQLQYDKTVLEYKSAQLPYIGFDQLEDFSAFQFWYMLSRARTTIGVRPVVRGNCNPDPDSFLRTFLDWWISKETGYAIPERAGVWRWFIRIAGELHWDSDPGVLRQRFNVEPGDPYRRVKSVAFFPATIHDNPILMQKDPGYYGWLESLPPVERERLLKGNWNIRPEAGKVFRRDWWEIIPAGALPARGARVRFWDKASTSDGGDWTVGVLMQRTGDMYFVVDVVRGQWLPGDRNRMIRQAAQLDTMRRPRLPTRFVIEEEGGSSGVDSRVAETALLAGYPVSFKKVNKADGSKFMRAIAYASQVQGHNVKLVAGDWNPAYIDEHQAFQTQGVPDDQVDAGSGAFNALAFGGDPTLPGTTSTRSLR